MCTSGYEEGGFFYSNDRRNFLSGYLGLTVETVETYVIM